MLDPNERHIGVKSSCLDQIQGQPVLHRGQQFQVWDTSQTRQKEGDRQRVVPPVREKYLQVLASQRGEGLIALNYCLPLHYDYFTNYRSYVAYHGLQLSG